MKSKAEWCQMEGFTPKESSTLIKYKYDSSNYWRNFSKEKKELDELDFKSEVLGAIRVPKVHIQKMRLAAMAWKSNHILPFMIPSIASFFGKMPEKLLINRKLRKNKLYIRELLKEKLQLDSDAIGKKGYNFDTFEFLNSNWDWVEKEILQCTYLDRVESKKILSRLKKSYGPKTVKERFASRLIYRLFMIAMWMNHSRYIN